MNAGYWERHRGKLKFKALLNEPALDSDWERSFYGDMNLASAIAIARHALITQNKYTYLFTAALLFHYPDILPDKSVLRKAQVMGDQNILREVNRCMYDNSDNYQEWRSSIS